MLEAWWSIDDAPWGQIINLVLVTQITANGVPALIDVTPPSEITSVTEHGHILMGDDVNRHLATFLKDCITSRPSLISCDCLFSPKRRMWSGVQISHKNNVCNICTGIAHFILNNSIIIWCEDGVRRRSCLLIPHKSHITPGPTPQCRFQGT